MKRNTDEQSAARAASELQETLERAIEALENSAGFDFERFLAEHPEHADAVRARVMKLRRTGMLRAPDAGAAPAALSGETVLPARSIAGRYRVLREIGRGGMGRVLLAHDERLAREIAIKLAHRVGDDAARARLEREARLLAQLEHPGIVAVYDGGTTEDGRAFCAMRVVGGRTLHEVITGEEALGLVRRVQIAIAVCDAVSFAHSRGIVHRDLKPANVMLGESGEVQVVDWGLAKRLGAPDPDAPADRESFASFSTGAYETVDGYAFGTPSYCAPEQARGEIAEIDQRSDVFGLGAILHHLLAGRPPYYGEDRAEVLARAEKGRFNDPELSHARPRVPPELVAVCRRATAPAKALRYASPSELANDLRAFLETRTVRAYRTGAWAETKKWLARNRSVAAALAVALVALIVGTITSVVYARRAVDESVLSDQVADALVGMFDSSYEESVPAKDVTAMQVLDRARDKQLLVLHDQPARSARLMHALARAYSALGSPSKAEPVAEIAVELYRSTNRTEDRARMANALALLGRAKAEMGDYEAAERMALSAVGLSTAANAPLTKAEVRARIDLALVLQQRGELERAATELAIVEPHLLREFGLETLMGAFFLNTRGLLRSQSGDLDGAVADNMLALESAEAHGAPADMRGLLRNNLASKYHALGRYDEARELNEQALALYAESLDPKHEDYLAARDTAAVLARGRKEFKRAEEISRAVVDARLEVNGPDARETLRAQLNLACVLIDLERKDEARELLDHVLKRQLEQFGPEDIDSLSAMFWLAVVHSLQERDDEALDLCARSCAGLERINAPRLRRASSLNLLMNLQRQRGDAVAAAESARKLLECAAPDSPEAGAARAVLGEAAPSADR